MSFDALIFDLDGTLWDCSAASASAFNLAYQSCGIDRQVSREFIRSISGKPSTECDEILLSGTSGETRRLLLQHLDEFELIEMGKHAATALYNGVHEGLTALSKNYRLAVVSNCGEKYLQIFRECTSVGSLFTDCECFGRTKRPKAENLRLLIDRQRFSSPCYIGDTASDEEAAAKAGVPFFHARYGFGVTNQSHQAFSSFEQLTHYFELGTVPSAPNFAGHK